MRLNISKGKTKLFLTIAGVWKYSPESTDETVAMSSCTMGCISSPLTKIAFNTKAGDESAKSILFSWSPQLTMATSLCELPLGHSKMIKSPYILMTDVSRSGIRNYWYQKEYYHLSIITRHAISHGKLTNYYIVIHKMAYSVFCVIHTGTVFGACI